MINREIKTVSLLTYSSTQDAYGQQRTGSPTSTNISAVVKPFSQTRTDDPRYCEAEYIMLTKSSVNPSNRVTIDQVTYDVLYVIPSKRENTVFIKKR